MNKGAFWKTGWFPALVITMVVGVFSRVSDLISSLEREACDLGVKATSKNPSDKLAVIAIDDQDIANTGRWRWSREVHAKMTDKLADTKAGAIGNTVFFFETQLMYRIANEPHPNILGQFGAATLDEGSHRSDTGEESG